MVSDVPVDNEAPMVTSGISRSAGPVLRGAHRGRVCICVFIGVNMRACCERLRCTVLKNKPGFIWDFFGGFSGSLFWPGLCLENYNNHHIRSLIH